MSIRNFIADLDDYLCEVCLDTSEVDYTVMLHQFNFNLIQCTEFMNTVIIRRTGMYRKRRTVRTLRDVP